MASSTEFADGAVLGINQLLGEQGQSVILNILPPFSALRLLNLWGLDDLRFLGCEGFSCFD